MNAPVYFLVRAWNAYRYFDRCISSIYSQRRRNYTILYIDDASPYNAGQKRHIQEDLKGHIVLFNKTRRYAVENAYIAIHRFVKEEHAIIINLDGDDWLISKDVVDIVVSTYEKTGCDFTYGNCIIHNPGDSGHNKVITDVDPGVNIRYSVEVERNKSYRKEIFFPRHLRTWKASVYKKIPMSRFMYPNKKWLHICEDEAIYFPMFEMSGKYEVIPIPLCAYNLASPYGDEKMNLRDRLQDEVYIRRQPPIAL